MDSSKKDQGQTHNDSLSDKDEQVQQIKSDYLQQLIETVDKLLQNEKFHNDFQQQFNRLCEMVESYIRELQKYEEITKGNLDGLPQEDDQAKDLLVKIQDTKLLADKIELWHQITQRYNFLHNKPPKEHPDWTLVGFINYIQRDELVSSLLTWHPPLNEMLVNPLLWFYPEMDKYFSSNDLARPPRNDEKLMCDFVRLAAIHDESCAYQTPTMVYKRKEYEGRFLRNDFTKDLWASYKTPKNKSFEETHKRTILYALENVKANLDKKAAETEQKIISTWHSRIGAWLWKLYERSLKVVFDAIMDKIGY